MSEKTGKNEALEAVSSLRQKLHKMQPILLKNGTKRRVMFEFENWRELANKKYSPSEYALYLETIFAYALYGYVPKGCEGSIADPNIKPGVEQIMSDAYYSCKERIDGFNKSREYGSEGGKNKNKNKGASDSTDGKISDVRLPNEFGIGRDPFVRSYQKVQSPDAEQIDYSIPVRCMSTDEMRAWYKRMSTNQMTSKIQGNPTAADWDEIYRYLDNNDWKKSGKAIFPQYLVSAVKWAWQSILNDRKEKADKIKRLQGDQTPPEGPGESVLKDAALAKQLAEKYGLKKNG